MTAGAGRALRLTACWLGLALLTWAGVRYAVHVPDAIPAYAPLTMFSGHRAMQHVDALATLPHATGSAGNAAVRAYLVSQLRQMGLQPNIQTTTGVGTRYPVAGRIHNVLARLPGRRPGGGAVLLMAHYDAVPASPGAADDGAGVGTLLETLSVLRAGSPLEHDVIALFTDGEEAGLLGAAAFAREHPWRTDVAVVLNFEARGTWGPSLMFETGPGNLDVVSTLRAVGGARATSLSTAVYRRLPNDTDLSELARLGVPALNFAFIGGVDRYHTTQDDVAHLDARSVQHHGNQALALTTAFANGTLPRPRTPDAVFFDYPGIGLVVYRGTWAVVLCILAIILTGAAIYRRKTGVSPVGVTLNAAAVIVAAGLSGLVGFATAALLQRLHAALRTGTPDSSAVYATAIVLLAVALSMGLLALLARRRDPPARGLERQLGSLIAWTLLGVAVSGIATEGSYLFIWPSIVFAVALLVEETGIAGAVARWVAVVCTMLLLVPTVYLMAFQALGVNQAGGVVLGFLSAPLAALVGSAVASAGDAEDRWTVIGAAAAAAGLLIIGAFTVRTDHDHPAGVSLLYAIDADSSGAWLTGNGSTASSRARLHHALGDMPSTGTTVAPPSWLRRSFGAVGVVNVPRMDLPRSEMTVLSDSTTDGERRVLLRVRPSPGTYSVAMAAERGTIIRATVDDKAVDRSRYRSRSPVWSLTYVAPPDSGFVLRLEMPGGTGAALTFLTRTPGIPSLHLPPRPDGIVQYSGGNMTLMRYRLTL